MNEISDVVNKSEIEKAYYYGCKEDLEKAYNQGRADAIVEFVDWLGSELATLHLFPDQRAKLYANIIRKKEQMQKGAE